MVGVTTIVGGFVGLIVAYSSVRYAGHVEQHVLEADERCERAWANVEVLLERRADEVGSLVDLAAEHAGHEQAVLQQVLDARQRALEAQQPAEAADASIEIREALAELFSTADAVPSLQSADRFDEIRDSLTSIERRLENRREHYNEAVAAYNVRIARFPERLAASRHGLESREPFRASDRAHERIDIRDRFDVSTPTPTAGDESTPDGQPGESDDTPSDADEPTSG